MDKTLRVLNKIGKSCGIEITKKTFDNFESVTANELTDKKEVLFDIKKCRFLQKVQ